MPREPLTYNSKTGELAVGSGYDDCISQFMHPSLNMEKMTALLFQDLRELDEVAFYSFMQFISDKDDNKPSAVNVDLLSSFGVCCTKKSLHINNFIFHCNQRYVSNRGENRINEKSNFVFSFCKVNYEDEETDLITARILATISITDTSRLKDKDTGEFIKSIFLIVVNMEKSKRTSLSYPVYKYKYIYHSQRWWLDLHLIRADTITLPSCLITDQFDELDIISLSLNTKMDIRPMRYHFTRKNLNDSNDKSNILKRKKAEKNNDHNDDKSGKIISRFILPEWVQLFNKYNGNNSGDRNDVLDMRFYDIPIENFSDVTVTTTWDNPEYKLDSEDRNIYLFQTEIML
jgi:hypothetical protein